MNYKNTGVIIPVMKRAGKVILVIIAILIAFCAGGYTHKLYTNAKTEVLPVENLTVETKGLTQTVSWSIINPDFYYKVFQSDDGGKKYSNEKTIKAGEEAKVVFKKLTPGKEYSYKVIACLDYYNGRFESEEKNASAKTDFSIVKSCKAELNTDDAYHAINFSWDFAENASGYEIKYSDNEDFTDAVTVNFAQSDSGISEIKAEEIEGEEGESEETEASEENYIQMSDDKTYAYALNNLNEDTTYYFSARAYTEDKDNNNEAIYTDWCKTASVKTDLEPLAVTKVEGTKPMVALTFDDGPDEEGCTESILDILAANNAHASFFLITDKAEWYPNAVYRIVNEGHDLGSHTMNHLNYGDAVTEDDIVWGNDAIQNICGVRPWVFRSPGGETNKDIRKVCKNEKTPIFYWSIDTRDWESLDPDAIVSMIKEQVEDGSIILMHSTYWTSVEAVDRIVPWLIKRGYELVTVSELVEAKTGEKAKAGKEYTDAFTVK